MYRLSEWIKFNRKKKDKEKSNERSSSQSGQENGIVDNQGQADRFNQEIPSTVIHFFPEPN